MTADTTGAGYSRRFVWLAAAIFGAIALYSAGWFYVAGLIDGEASEAIASANGDGVRLNCENSQIKGYPFRLGLNCDSVAFEHAVEGLAFSAGAFRSAAQVYNPRFLVSELDGKARLEVPGLLPLTFDWDVLRSSVRLAEPIPSRVSVEARRFRAAAVSDSRNAMRLFAAEDMQVHMRPNNETLDLAASFRGFAVDKSLLQGRILPPLEGGIDLALDDGVGWVMSGNRSLRSQAGTLRQLFLSPNKDSAIAATGTFQIDAAGFIDADLAITVRGADALAEVAVTAFPESANEIASFTASLQALGEDAELPLRVVKGKVTYGFVELGSIPPLP